MNEKIIVVVLLSVQSYVNVRVCYACANYMLIYIYICIYMYIYICVCVCVVCS